MKSEGSSMPGKDAGLSRRQLLRGQVNRTTAKTCEQAPPEQLPESIGQSDHVVSQVPLQCFSHRAMGCEFSVFFPANVSGAADAAMSCFELIDGLEERWSVFRSDSLVSRFNQSPVGTPIELDEASLELFELSRQLAAKTRGAFDVTSAGLTQRWRRSHRDGALPSDEEIRLALLAIGNDRWSLDTNARTATRHDPRLQVDFGAIGKGYALDMCVQTLHESGCNHFLIHGGNSSVVAAGSPDGRAASHEDLDSGWIVGIVHPILPGERIGEIRLCDAALATSGTRRQGMTFEGRWYGHIIDPRSGQPQSKTASVSVVSHRAAVADAFATAFYVMNESEVEAILDEFPRIGAVICTADRKIRRLGRLG